MMNLHCLFSIYLKQPFDYERTEYKHPYWLFYAFNKDRQKKLKSLFAEINLMIF